MLPKKFRARVQNFPKHSRTLVRGNFVVVKGAPNRVGYDRLGVLVSKKAAKKTTARNKIRRAVYQSIKLKKQKGDGKDILVIVNTPPPDPDALIDEIESLQGKITKST